MKTQLRIPNLLKATLFYLLFFVSFSVQATVYRVNNSVTEQAGIVYNQVTSAIAAASPGDTIYVEGSGATYVNFTVDKQLSIFGPGFLHASNPGLQANPNAAFVSQINVTGAGSKISGMSVNLLYVGAENCVIERNRLNRQLYLGYSNGQNVNNTVIKQNFFIYAGVNVASIEFTQSASRGNIFIANNIFERFVNLNGAGASGICINNTARMASTSWSINIPGFQVINNVMTIGLWTNNTSNSFFNNIGSGTQFPTGNGNQQNVAEASVLQIGVASTDGQYQIVAAGPAEGAGQTGVDCGAFGGADTYKLSGISSIPTIYELVAPSSGTNSIDVTISTRSNQ